MRNSATTHDLVPKIFGTRLSAPTRRQAMSDGDQYLWSNDDDETSAGDSAVAVDRPKLAAVRLLVRIKARVLW
ncbi:hypothetical protein LguiA_034320 [Lonicera macranthoides]